MKTLIVYDSVFGNTEKIALKIRDSIQGAVAVKVTDVDPTNLGELDYLIVGSPTRAFNPTKDTTSFLKNLPSKSLNGVKVAAFDTRINVEDVNNLILSFMVRVFGYADKPIENKLKNKGGTVVAPSSGFYVMDTEGPLKEGEMERAEGWGRQIVS